MNIRSILASALLASSALAAPPLTTIQDVLYKADGARFNGTVTISWTSFEALDNSAIATQSTTIRVVDGNLRVQLVPTTSSTPAVYYTAKYNSDGRVQFAETWSVPSSAQPVRLRDVRVAASTASETSGPPPGETTGPVAETDVVGLIADLGSRPLKGPGYAAGRVAVVSPLGALESVTGSATDCVRVDGSTGPCGDTAPSFVDGDALTGIVDGSNASFGLSGAPNPAESLSVYRNGILQKAGADYTANGSGIQFVAASAPQPGDTLLASYRVTGNGSGSAPQMFPAPQALCGGTGAATNGAVYAGIGSCTIPGGLLAPGDRVEIRFDLEHQGSGGGYSFKVLWGATTIAERAAALEDTLVSGRAEAAILNSGAQLSQQSWGTVLPLGAGVATSADAGGGGITISFQGKLSQPGDTVTLRGFTVVRLP